MVRADHEDGGVLNPDDNSEKTDPVVVKSSPLRRKPKRPARTSAATEFSQTSVLGESSETDEMLVADAAQPDPEAPDTVAPDTVDSGPDASVTETIETAESATEVVDTAAIDADVSYRDRRLGAQRRRTAAEAATATRRAPQAGV
ncbi:MAG: hypothetical protein WAW85_05090, partial [Gordonia sp. (in: high G+C Gram-positive bacteria)]